MIMKRTTIYLLAIILISGCRETPSQVITGRNITAIHGMVVSAHPEASGAGVSILQKGGNAIDAAVATEFALSVCYPEAGNIGGGGFMLIRMNDGSSDVVDYREKAPMGATRDMYLDEKGILKEGSSTESHLAAGVPGTVDGMLKVHRKYGRLSLREVIQPAIELAAKGFTITEEQAGSFNRNREYFLKMNATPPAFVKNGEWKAGDVLLQPDLAATLERIRDNGREGFYSGKTAEMIIREMKRGKGIISAIDLTKYEAKFRKPLSGEYRGFRIITIPPPSSGGIILLQLLKMIEPWPLRESGFHSLKAIHLIAEAEKRAFADRAEYAGDPDFIDVHTSTLLDQKYLKRRFKDFDRDQATDIKKIKAGLLSGYESNETTHYSVVDKDGNAVSATTTLNNLFGSGIVVEGAGFLLNDQMDDFSVKPGTPNMYGLVGGEANSISPGKRMLSSMTPSIVEKDGKLFLIAGSPGGSTIPTTVFQVITNVIDYKMDIRQAVDTGRFHDQWLPDYIMFEKGSIDSLVLEGLKRMDYDFKERSVIGSVNAIEMLPDGKIRAGADRRGYNTACGY
jgi:gamma-glutamyltranspeptidase / glutathione hydrolase